MKFVVCLTLLAVVFVHQSDAAMCYTCVVASVNVGGLGLNTDPLSCTTPVRGATPAFSCSGGCMKSTGAGSLILVSGSTITRGCDDLCVASATTTCCNGDYCNGETPRGSVNGLKFSLPLLIAAFVASIMLFR